ncbi:DUF4351 domain-containing protein [Sorangium sp. So ce1014]|uniref:DUF4351 domain-containing protein n=1 Tax=Sorangium sp. So ce1014 TaxID=3133326 RepID=UPI003F6167B5
MIRQAGPVHGVRLPLNRPLVLTAQPTPRQIQEGWNIWGIPSFCARIQREIEQGGGEAGSFSEILLPASPPPRLPASPPPRLARVWRYILNIADPAQPRELLQRLLAAAGPEAKEEIVTIADYLREQGRLAGERGGRLEGQRSTLLKLLRLRFGELPEPIVVRVRAVDARQIESWTERVLTAPTVDDVLTER